MSGSFGGRFTGSRTHDDRVVAEAVRQARLGATANTSQLQSSVLSQSSAISLASSTAQSAGTAASTTLSTASTNASIATSQNASQSLLISNHESRLVSKGI